jgi:hypothetical protein
LLLLFRLYFVCCLSSNVAKGESERPVGSHVRSVGPFNKDKKSHGFFFHFFVLSRSNPLLYPDTPKKCWKLSVIVCNTPRLKHTTCRDERTCCNNFQITTERKKKKKGTRQERKKQRKRGNFFKFQFFTHFSSFIWIIETSDIPQLQR